MDKRLRRWYNDYNRKYFEGRLPKGINLEIRWLAWKEPREEAACWPWETPVRAHFNKNYLNGVAATKIALLHEMVHISLYAQGHTTVEHGALFEEETTRLKLAGAYKGLL